MKPRRRKSKGRDWYRIGDIFPQINATPTGLKAATMAASLTATGGEFSHRPPSAELQGEK